MVYARGGRKCLFRDESVFQGRGVPLYSEIIANMYMCMHVFQTLLKTTNHILVHDVRGSLNHLCTLVQQGVSPHSRQCVICSRPADSLADGSKDDVLIFRCACVHHMVLCLCFLHVVHVFHYNHLHPHVASMETHV